MPFANRQVTGAALCALAAFVAACGEPVAPASAARADVSSAWRSFQPPRAEDTGPPPAPRADRPGAETAGGVGQESTVSPGETPRAAVETPDAAAPAAPAPVRITSVGPVSSSAGAPGAALPTEPVQLCGDGSAWRLKYPAGDFDAATAERAFAPIVVALQKRVCACTAKQPAFNGKVQLTLLSTPDTGAGLAELKHTKGDPAESGPRSFAACIGKTLRAKYDRFHLTSQVDPPQNANIGATFEVDIGGSAARFGWTRR